MTLTPFCLEPVLVSKPWGGRRLAEFGKSLPPDEAIGESWDVADLDPLATSVPDPATRVATGALAGATLRQVIARHGRELLGDATPAPGGRFPLLVKLLDARQSLSVQVHPPAAYVAAHSGAHLKTESWVVVDADPKAELLLGLVEGTTQDDIATTLGTPDMLPLLRRVPARAGDVHHLPAGLIHALGAGVLVAEVQTPSDTTYRLYDWVDEYGRTPRELQLEAGLECLRLEWATNTEPPPTVTGSRAGTLLDTPHYRLARHMLGADERLGSPDGEARILLVLQGTVRVADLPVLSRGGVAILPAAWSGDIVATTDSTLLIVTP